MDQYSFNKVNWLEAKNDLSLIRTQVFIEEQSVPVELEWDEHDKNCIHLLVLFKNNPIATARMQKNGHIGRIAVLKEHRHQGIGSAMLDILIDYCNQHKLRPHLDAQIKAIGFYQKKGFCVISEEFLDAGIPHKSMEINMEYNQYILGENNELLNFDSRLDNRNIATTLISQAKVQIRILTPNLEHMIYDTSEITQSLSKLAIKNKHTLINVLINDATQAVITGHRLIELSRKFSSSIHLHKTPVDMAGYETAFILIDDTGYLYKHRGNSHQGQACFNDMAKVRDLTKTFDEAWAISKPDPELRQLYI